MGFYLLIDHIIKRSKHHVSNQEMEIINEKMKGHNPFLHQPIPRIRLKRKKENESMTKKNDHFMSPTIHLSIEKQYDVWKPLEVTGISRTRVVSWNGIRPLDVQINFKRIVRNLSYHKDVVVVGNQDKEKQIFSHP